MATPRTATPPATPPADAPPAGGDPSSDDLKSAIREVMSEMGLGAGEPPAADPPADQPDVKPLTAREEETRMERIVSKAIDALKAAEPPKTDDKNAPGHTPEPIPGKKAVRWVEKHLWGVDA